MASRPPLSVVIITLNEEHNIARCIKSLRWAEEILVMDSHSTDRTRGIAEELGARVENKDWMGYGQQKNYASSLVKHDWIFYIDADEECGIGLQKEIEDFLGKNGVMQGTQYWGASFPRKTFFLGRWIMHGGWYPNILTRLSHKKYGYWTEPAVHEALELSEGPIYRMKNDLLHYTFRDVGDQVITNVKFSRLGAKVAKNKGEKRSIGKIFCKPIGKFLETYFWKLGFLDGLPGLVISINAAHSIFMKYVELYFEKNSRC